MFKLVRWLFLLGIIAALAGFLVGKPIHGKTPAESFCKLIDNSDCGKLAARGAVELAWLRGRWENAAGTTSPHPAPQPAPATQATKTAEREPKPAHAAPVATAEPPVTGAPGPAALPLDRHTVAERQALDRILTQRGSR